MKHTVNSPDATIGLAVEFSKKLTEGDIVFLSGSLGAGKTHFVRGVIEGLQGQSRDVSSPTYGLVHEYPTPQCPVFHLDLYRLAKAADVLDLELETARQSGVLLVEWPDKAEGLLGEATCQINLEFTGDESREIEIIWT